jgi:hypothetical protein
MFIEACDEVAPAPEERNVLPTGDSTKILRSSGAHENLLFTAVYKHRGPTGLKK